MISEIPDSPEAESGTPACLPILAYSNSQSKAFKSIKVGGTTGEPLGGGRGLKGEG
jgi:hypothetical protein